jgi:hypothetical protein
MKPIAIRPLTIASLLLVTSLAVYGCGGEPTTPASPRGAYIQVAEALTEGNEARLLAAVEANEWQKEMLRAVMHFTTTLSGFRDAFVKAYGEQAWKDFQDDSKAPKDGNANLSVTDAKEIVAKIRNLAIEERGDEAFCDSPDEPGKKVRFVKVKDGWRVDVGRDLPGETEARKQMGQMRDLAGAVRKYQKAIGRPGIKPEDIDAELGRELARLLKGLESPAPHRFDVNAL